MKAWLRSRRLLHAQVADLRRENRDLQRLLLPRPSTRCNRCGGPLPVDPCTPDDALLPVCDECCPECNPEGTR